MHKDNQKEVVKTIIERAKFFKTPDSRPYIVMPKLFGNTALFIEGVEINKLIAKIVHGLYGHYPSSGNIKYTKDCLIQHAMLHGKTKEVFQRIGHNKGSIFIDMCNGKYIKITSEDIKVLKKCPVVFNRTSKMLPLPTPKFEVEGYKGLKELINVDKADRFLIISWVMAALMPTGTFPALILQGEQGSAKSCTLKMLKSIIDPCTSPLQSMPHKEEDLIISAANNKITIFDNVSHISNSMSDSLCRIASGNGITKRKLYTDNDECTISAKSIFALNGIGDFVTRGDLLSRSIIIETPVITTKKE